MLKNQIQNLSQAYFEEIREYRRHLHANPELSFHEYNTSAFIKEKLNKESIFFEDNWANTGIVATIYGKNAEKSTTMLRADIDALPIQELNNSIYKSKNDGVMHACGHDVHTASMLGACIILNDLKQDWEGTVIVIFQPAEEKLPGGASKLIEEGLFEKHTTKSIFGQHVYPELPAGKVGFKKGMYMASCDELYITVKGKGGHAALPHRLIDPILVSSHLIVALQQMVSRRASPSLPAVLSIGKIEGKGATNVIPDMVKMEGTFRTFDEEWRVQAHDEIRKLCKNLCSSMGADCDIQIEIGYPYVDNDIELTGFAEEWAREYLGTENVEELEMRATAEDFGSYSQIVPGCFYRLGTGNTERGITASLHNPKFDIDEDALKTGMGLMAWLAVKRLGN